MVIKRILSINGILLALFLVGLLVAGLFAGVDILRLSLFLCINITAIILPGFLLLKCSSFHFKNYTTQLFVSYGVGYVLMALMYAILVYFNLHHLSPYVLYAISVVSMLALLNQKLRNDLLLTLSEKNDDNRFLLALMVLLFVFCFMVFQFPLRFVGNTGYLDMHFDNTYWFKNCIAATKGYPFPELSIYGVTLSWHMFSCFEIALFHFSTGIEIYDFCFSLSYVWHVFMMVGSAYALSKKILINRNYVFTSMVLILLCSSAEPYTIVYYLDHLWGCSMGTSDAIAVSMFAMLLLLECINHQKINWQFVPLTILMMIAATGYKSANGAILLVGVTCALGYLCIKNRKMLFSSLLFLLMAVILFVVLCKTFIIAEGALTSSTSNHRLALNFMTVLRPDINTDIVSSLEDVGVRPLITVIFLAIPYLLCVHPAMPLFAVTIVALIFRKKRVWRLDYDKLSACIPFLAMSVAGILVFLSFNHPGFAQCYFLFSGIPFEVLFSFAIIEQYFAHSYQKHRFWLYCILLISFVATIACAKEVYTLDGKYFPNPRRISLEGTSLTAEEIKGLRWARENLPQDAVLLTNKVLAPVRGERSFITSTYTERHVYIEGYISANLPNDHIVADRLSLTKRYFGSDVSAKDELRREGVTHVVVYKSLSNMECKGDQLLYKNEEIEIWTL